jgi:hypothetical protein
VAAGSAQAAAMTYTVDGPDTIDFHIPGAGVHTITSRTSALPDITDQASTPGAAT